MRGKVPYLYKKFLEMGREYVALDARHQIEKAKLEEELSRKFRLTREDVYIIMNELRRKRKVSTPNRNDYEM